MNGEWTFNEMTAEAAATIVGWRYPEPYGFYNVEKDAADLADFLNSARWVVEDLQQSDIIVAAYRSAQLSGYFSYAGGADVCTIGLGLAPALIGQGFGHDFVAAGLEFAIKRWGVTRFRLEVANFNSRAIEVYERLGFERRRTLVREDGGEWVEFLEMVR